MENNCQNNQEQIAGLIAGTLSAQEAAALQEHIKRCPACSKYLEALRADDRMLGDFVGAMRPTVSRIEKNVAEALTRRVPAKAAGSVSVWRKIMKSRITRLATAAAIILAAGILLKSLNDGTAWAKVVAAFNKADNIHIVKKERSGDGRIIRENESWVKNQTLFRAESNNWCVINDGSKVLSLYKDQQIADLRESVTPHWDYTPIILKVFQGGESVKGTTVDMLSEESTHEMHVYEISFRDHWQGKAWVNAANKLPVRIVGREKADSGSKKEFEITLRYEPIPDKTFDTAVPASFQELPRIANRPHSEEREVLFGKVVDKQGNPVAGAEVYASYAHHGRTDENGDFALLVHPDDGSNSLGPADFPMFIRAYRKDEPQSVAWTIIRHPSSGDSVFAGVDVLDFRNRAMEIEEKSRHQLSEGHVVERTHHGVELLFEDDSVLAENIPGDPGELFGDIDDEPKVRNIKLVMDDASTITGRITNTSSEPIANATVLIEEMKQYIGVNTIAVRNLGGELEDKAFAITDSGGYFELNNLPARWDNVRMKVKVDGYRTMEKEFEHGGRTVVDGCDFELVAGEPEEPLERASRYFGVILSSRAAAEGYEHYQEAVSEGHPVRAGGGSIAEVVPAGLHQNLVLYYSFHANTDPAAVVDISGNGFNGRVHGAKYANDEVLGGVMSFDGEDDYISVSDVFLKEFSFSAWVNTHGSGINNRRIFTLSDGGRCYGLQGNVGGGVGVYVADNEEVNEYNWRLGKYTWTHITVTHDGRRFAIYRNGRLTETGNIETSGVEGTLYLGGTSKHHGGFWNGMIDEVVIFNRALTSEEVKQLYSMTGEIVEEPTTQEESGADELKNELVEADSVSSTKHTIATAFAGEIVYPADVDGDGDLDVVGASEGNDRRLFISTHSGISLSSRRGRPEILSNSSKDGDRGGIYWWENTDSRAVDWMKHAVDTNVMDVRNAYPADVDRDGDVDMIGSASGRELAWWENSRGDGSSWSKHTIDNSVGGAQLVHAADFDSDGDIDVVGATWLDGGINWWENVGGNGTGWQKHTIDGAMNADYSRTHCMSVADMDGDGKLDVVASAGRESGVNWWENPKVSGAEWTRHYVLGSDGEVESVYAADLDGDGDMDLIGSIRRHDGLTWWENIKGTGTGWTKHIIDSAYHAEQRIDAEDMDGDGDVDILGAAQRINTVLWWENKNGNASEWAKHIMSRDFGDAYYSYAVDMDGDGDLDILSVGEDAKEIAWFESRPSSD